RARRNRAELRRMDVLERTTVLPDRRALAAEDDDLERCHKPSILAPAFSRVDLRPLQLATEIDVDRFPFGEHVKRRRAGFAMAVAGSLGADEWQMHLRADRRSVDV